MGIDFLLVVGFPQSTTTGIKSMEQFILNDDQSLSEGENCPSFLLGKLPCIGYPEKSRAFES